MKTSIIFLFLLYTALVTRGQCPVLRLDGTGLLTGTCGDLQFQGTIGTAILIYGNCGGLSFDSPITGGGFPSAVTEQNTPLVFTIYPNPAIDEIFIHCTGVESYRVHIYNMHGNRVDVSSNGRIPLDGLPTGFYGIRIMDLKGKLLHSQSFIKI